jgi:hypothetical protein
MERSDPYAIERGMANVRTELSTILEGLNSSAKYLRLLGIIPEVRVFDRFQ